MLFCVQCLSLKSFAHSPRPVFAASVAAFCSCWAWRKETYSGWWLETNRYFLSTFKIIPFQVTFVRFVSFFSTDGKFDLKKTKEVESIILSKHKFLLKTSWRLSLLKSHMIRSVNGRVAIPYTNAAKCISKKWGAMAFNGGRKTPHPPWQFFAWLGFFSLPTSNCMQLLEIQFRCTTWHVKVRKSQTSWSRTKIP